MLHFFESNAQIHEIGIFVGGSNYIGDIGKTSYIDPNEPAFGLVYKWNKSPRHAYRISYTQSTISANDTNASDLSRRKRGYSFKNNLKDITIGLEFNFFDFNLHQLGKRTTPYLFTGISYVNYDEKYFLTNVAQLDINHGKIAIPMTLGIKSNITPSIILAAEVNAKYSFTDNLDGSNPKNIDLENLKFGNINSNDWYVFTGITLTYTFGEKPCYCAD